jgi:hypothetical protein
LQQEKSAVEAALFYVVFAIALGVTRQFFNPSFPRMRESIGL